MIAVQIFFEDRVKDELGKAGCRFVAPIDDNNDLWATAWGMHFTVPALGPDRGCARSKLHEILADIERHRPTNH